MNRQMRELVREAERQGWQRDMTRTTHVKLISPDGKPVFMSNTPSDHRALANAVAFMRKLGFKWKGR